MSLRDFLDEVMMGRPTLNVGGIILWARVPDHVKKRKRSECLPLAS